MDAYFVLDLLRGDLPADNHGSGLEQEGDKGKVVHHNKHLGTKNLSTHHSSDGDGDDGAHGGLDLHALIPDISD